MYTVFHGDLETISSWLESIYSVFVRDLPNDDEFGSVGELESMNGWMKQIRTLLTDLPNAFHDMLFDLYHEINNEVNPLSDDNSEAFSAALVNIEENTFIGSVRNIVTSGNDFFGSLDQTSEHSITMSTFEVTFYGKTIPAKQIKLDLSWYERIRETAHNIIRAFIYIWWLWKFVFVRIYELLNGVGASAIEVASNYMPDTPTSTDHVTFDDNGVVTSYSTRTKNSDGSTFTQYHKV